MPPPRKPLPLVLESLVAAFRHEFGIAATDGAEFGNPTAGLTDDVPGVQWNTWIDTGADAAYLSVNLEGKKYDDWPIARFIEREFRLPLVFEVRTRVTDPDAVQVIWTRDAWQFASRPAIRERHIGASQQSLSALTPDAWRATLQEAYQCLDPKNNFRGRATQTVTVKRGRVELPVTPHLQFRRRLGSLSSYEWRGVIHSAHELLAPLHEYAVRQSAE